MVTAVYNVESYLPDFIASIDAQSFGADGVQVVAVDDGSTDRSLELLHAWAERAAYEVVVLTKENGGQSTARNHGLAYATGEWVSFADPDDMFSTDYLRRADLFIDEHPEAVLIACNLLLLQDQTGELEDLHPMRYRFRGKAQVRDLDKKPAYYFGSANACLFRRADIEATGLRFDAAIRPNFEDGVFTATYLLGFDRPLVGFVPEAKYHYRKRADNSSTMGQSAGDGGRYTTVVRLGYRDLMRTAARMKDGRVPEWLQNLILYDISWIITIQLRAGSASSAEVERIGAEFHALMAEVVELIDPEIIDASPVIRINRLWRDVLLHAWSDEDWRDPVVQITHFDRKQGLIRLLYRFTGDRPTEQLLSGGEPVTPVHAKVRDVRLLGRVVMHERIVWVPSGKAIAVRLNGRSVPLDWEPQRRRHEVGMGFLRHNLDRRGLRVDRFRRAPLPVPVVAPDPNARSVLRLARTRPVARKFARAWVLMDRVHNAGDSGQVLFEYLRAEHPDINAWFVLEQDAPEWAGLRKRYGSRVVAYGSLRWKLLLLNAAHVLSSHADQPIQAPTQITQELGVVPEWRFTFLQHGVIKDDLSNWLNPKLIDTFITSTPAEQESIVADHTSYVFTTREAVLTGLPRFDRLRELGNRVPVEDRDLILIAPTWRNWLTAPVSANSQVRNVFDGFADSEFAVNWLGLLQSSELIETARASGLTVAFLPHPNLRAALEHFELPAEVVSYTFEDNDVQELFARAAVLVTDYSSMAFNAAYLDRPVVYFQFDAERVLSGEHVGSKGYYEYERDGYGPVETDLAGAVAAVQAAALARVPTAVYQARIEAAFPERDGRCCERVVAAVRASESRAKRQA